MKVDFLFTPYQKIIIIGLKIFKLTMRKKHKRYKISVIEDKNGGLSLSEGFMESIGRKIQEIGNYDK